MKGTMARKAGRGGGCLLARLLRCARCGRMLHVVYGRGDYARYECRATARAYGAPRCIGFSARRPDETVGAAMLAVVPGQALAAAIEVGDLEIAACLNRLRLRTGAGNTWTASRVLSVRKRLRLVDYDEAAATPMLTLYRGADRLGVGPWVVRQLIRRGPLEATQVVPCAPWQIDPARLDTDAVRRAAKAVEGRTRRPRSRIADSQTAELIEQLAPRAFRQPVQRQRRAQEVPAHPAPADPCEAPAPPRRRAG